MNDPKAKILELRKSKVEADRRNCISLLETFLAANPKDVDAWYAKAGCHDFLGEEQAALPCYHQVYAIGWRELPKADQASFFVGYGSTLRNNLAFDESNDRLAEGVQHFPNYPALKVFRALSLYSQGKDQKAAEVLFSAVLEAATVGLDGYERALKWYVENLNLHPTARRP